MSDAGTATGTSASRIILYPALITLAVTLIRVVGELQQGSKKLFNAEPGGAWAIVGIVWLVPIFGAYFGFRLARAGDRPARVGRGLAIGLLGAVVLVAGYLLFQKVMQSLTGIVVMWTMAALAGSLQIFSWRRLFSVLAAYAYSARIPVAIVMFVATIKNWPSHYNANVPGFSTWSGFLLFGFIPQLVWWVSFTIVLGMIAGLVAAALAKGPPQSAPSVS